MKIAFFDSGIGGLTVLHEALKILPSEQYIYFADSDNAPYGIKTSQEIRELVFDAVEFLIKQDIKALVLACNTATSVAVKELRATYTLPIIGMEPAVKPALKTAEHRKTLICATQKTLEEDKLKELIQNLNAESKVEQLSLQNLVVFAEKFEFQLPEVKKYLSDCFASVNWTAFDSVVLGCTHFSYFTDIIRSLLPAHVRILSGNEGTVRQLQRIVAMNTDTERTCIEYYISGKKADARHFDRYFNLLNKSNGLQQE
jgi:glutamate racemase